MRAGFLLELIVFTIAVCCAGQKISRRALVKLYQELEEKYPECCRFGDGEPLPR
jgi:hypothetical protein